MNDWKSAHKEGSAECGVQSQIPRPVTRNPVPAEASSNREFSLWAQRWTLAGAAGWAVMAMLARLEFVRIGMIELLFLFGPLVIVPLGLELQRIRGATGFAFRLTQMLQPLGAVVAVEAVCLPPGRRAAFFAMGWMAVCALATLSGALEIGKAFLGKSGRATWLEIAFAIAKIDLAVAGAWFVASRLGVHPMGILEPIGLLTAVHFHFAGFATATIAAATLNFAQDRDRARWLRLVVGLVVLLPFMVAAGFVISPVLKMTSAVSFSISVVLLAGFLWKSAAAVEDHTARIFLRIAAGSIFAGMILSTAYAIADFVGSEALPIPRMASTHGVINAVGFCLCGLLGWIVESESRIAAKT